REGDAVRVVGEAVKILPDETAQQITPRRIRHVIKLFRHENAFVAGERWRLGETGGVDVVRGAPRTIHPMRTGLDDIVLEKILVEQNQTAFVASVSELIQARPVPRIEPGEIILAQSVPRGPLPAARERLLEKRRQHAAVDAARALVIIAAAVIPQTIMLIERHLATC